MNGVTVRKEWVKKKKEIIGEPLKTHPTANSKCLWELFKDKEEVLVWEGSFTVESWVCRLWVSQWKRNGTRGGQFPTASNHIKFSIFEKKTFSLFFSGQLWDVRMLLYIYMDVWRVKDI